MRFDIWYIAIALLMLLAGEVFGEWMANNRDHGLAMVHAHLNVAGWASFALFGLIHHAFPTLASSRLALPQFLIATFSTLFFIAGLWVVLVADNPLGAVLGSYGLILATALFIFMFFKHVVFAGRTSA